MTAIVQHFFISEILTYSLDQAISNVYIIFRQLTHNHADLNKKKETEKNKRPKEHFDLICIWINIFSTKLLTTPFKLLVFFFVCWIKISWIRYAWRINESN